MSLLLGPDILFIKKGSVLAIRALHYIYQEEQCSCYKGLKLNVLGREVFGPDTTILGREVSLLLGRILLSLGP